MPTLNKGTKKKTERNPNRDAHIYNHSWSRLRLAYLMEHPLCERCLKDGKTKEAEEVHHVTPISRGRTPLEMMDLMLNENNLMALCKECHHRIHNEI